MKRDYEPDARATSPALWRELGEVCQRVHRHLYENGNKTAARRYRRRLEKLTRELPDNDLAILREEALALLHELDDDIPEAVRHREREIELIERAHDSVRESIRSGRCDEGMGASILADWNQPVLDERREILRGLRAELDRLAV
ncbi:MAG TPA: hypothetical protein VNH11_34785 [Pirellulales bacterium]|nr:hypothetical protein [Pirellulales bacterium]